MCKNLATHPVTKDIEIAFENEDKTVEVDTRWVRSVSLIVKEFDERYDDQYLWIKKTNVGRPNTSPETLAVGNVNLNAEVEAEQ